MKPSRTLGSVTFLLLATGALAACGGSVAPAPGGGGSGSTSAGSSGDSQSGGTVSGGVNPGGPATGTSGPTCSPGATIPCDCSNGAKGIETCQDDGRGYGVCGCPRLCSADPPIANPDGCPFTYSRALAGQACPSDGLECNYPGAGDVGSDGCPGSAQMLCKVAPGGTPVWALTQ